MNRQTATTKILTATELTEGAGVTVHRTIGTPQLRRYDPFMLLDQISSDEAEDYIAGFPPHPHRGFVTFTYMIDGDMEHRDSLGNTGNLGPGGAQWMKAASGIIHSEMPKQDSGLLRGFQLWVNLPAAHKWDVPEYQEYHSAAFPVIDNDDYRAKVLIGRLQDAVSPIIDTITDVNYIDVQLHAGKAFHYAAPHSHRSFVYVFEGEASVDEQSATTQTMVILEPRQAAHQVLAGASGARFLLVSGKPINEPVVQYGPFVMNNKEEIDQAMQEYHSNQFIRDCAWVNRQ